MMKQILTQKRMSKRSLQLFVLNRKPDISVNFYNQTKHKTPPISVLFSDPSPSMA